MAAWLLRTRIAVVTVAVAAAGLVSAGVGTGGLARAGAADPWPISNIHWFAVSANEVGVTYAPDWEHQFDRCDHIQDEYSQAWQDCEQNAYWDGADTQDYYRIDGTDQNLDPSDPAWKEANYCASLWDVDTQQYSGDGQCNVDPQHLNPDGTYGSYVYCPNFVCTESIVPVIPLSYGMHTIHLLRDNYDYHNGVSFDPVRDDQYTYADIQVVVGVPPVPTVTGTEAANGEAAVTWDPGTPAGAPGVIYTVTANPGGQTCFTGLISCTVTGLTNGTTYSFSVRAGNVYGYSITPDWEGSATPHALAPSTPTHVVAEAGLNSAVVSWTAPPDNGATITKYVVTSANGTCRSQSTAPTPAATTCTVSPLAAHTTQSFTVTATNSVGTSAASAPSAPLSVFGAPGAPTNVVATPGSMSADVSWTAPADDGGSPLGLYTVTASPGGQSCVASAPATSCTVGNLSDGTAYTFTVVANNQFLDPSKTSDPSNSVVVGSTDPPLAPTDVTVAAGSSVGIGNAGPLVTWQAPLGGLLTGPPDGGSPITKYTVSSTPAGGTCTAVPHSPNGPYSCHVNSGLTAGTSYHFTVTATNASGTGPASSPSKAIVAGVPGAPTGVITVPGDAADVVSWLAPAGDGGAAITSYTASARGPKKDLHTCTATKPSCTIAGLTDGTTYTVTVVATNAHGTGPASSAISSLPPGAPTAPTEVTVTPIDDSPNVAVSFHAPASNNGAAITSYRVLEPGLDPGTSFTVCTSTASPCTFNPGAFSFSVAWVVAVNSHGAGAPSSQVFVYGGAPTAPQHPTATAANQSANLSWSVPAHHGQSPLNGYVAYADPGNIQVCSISVTPPAVPPTNCVASGLTNGRSYTFRIAAKTATGSSTWATTGAIVPGTPPSAPLAVTASPGDAIATVSWQAPTDSGFSAITGYTVTSDIGPGCSTPANTTQCLITGLANGVAYRFTVTATNGFGPGTPSAQSQPLTPGRVPDPPTHVRATGGDTTANVSWLPAAPNGYAIDSYTVAPSGGGTPCTALAPITQCTVTGLQDGQTYTFTVTAHNALGASTPSNATDDTMIGTVPGAPTGVTATADDGSATVDWTAPVQTGGPPLTQYTVTASPGGKTCVLTDLSGNLECTVIGLSANAQYTFTVTASNVMGEGPASDPSQPVTTPEGVPGPPTAVAALGGANSAHVSWAPPVNDGGSAITSYTVTASPGGATVQVDGSQTGVTVTGLADAALYTFTVVATNDNGDSVASAPSNVAITSGNVSPQTFVWSGAAGDELWSDPGNWVGGVAPITAGATLQFPDNGSASGNDQTIDDLPSGGVVALDFEADGYGVSGGSLSLTNITVAAGDAAEVDSDLTLNTQMTTSVGTDSVLHLGGTLSGPQGLTVTGAGEVELIGYTANTNTGADVVHGRATLKLAKQAGMVAMAGPLVVGDDFSGNATAWWAGSSQIDSPTASVLVAGSGKLDLDAWDDTFGTLTLNSGTVTTGTGTLTVDGDIYNNNTSGEIDGNLQLGPGAHTIGEANSDNRLDIEATLTGSGPITKLGAGALTLGDACAALGTLTVDAGSVRAPLGYGGEVAENGGTFVGPSCLSAFVVPAIGSVAPAHGPELGGTTVTITGTGLAAATGVTFGGVAADFNVVDSDHITATAPAGMGTVDVVVSAPGGDSVTSANDQFTYDIPNPTIFKVLPGKGSFEGNTVVTLAGIGFRNASKVMFGTHTATNFTVVSDNQITVHTPPAVVGVVDVHVTTPIGTSATVNADHYTYTLPPALGGYTLDKSGQLHGFGLGAHGALSAPVKPSLATGTQARGVALFPDDTGGYIVDGTGAFHAFGLHGHKAPGIPKGLPSWPHLDMVRGVVILPDETGGFVLDEHGGLHPFILKGHTMPKVPSGLPSWPHTNTARGIALLPDESGGFIIDGTGGLHAFGLNGNAKPALPRTSPRWPNKDLARGLAILPDGTGGYVIDDTGVLHAFALGAHAAPAVPKSYTTWPAKDNARAVVFGA